MSQSNLSKVMNTILTGGSNTVLLSDTTEVTIMVCNGETLPRLLNFAATVSEDLGLSLSDAESIKDRLLSKADDVAFILKLISNHYDDAVALIPLLAGLTKEQVYDLDPADSIALINAIVLLNQDFFTKTVLPALGLAKAVRAQAAN